MPLRLFGGQGGSRVRACPACEREIAAEATFCPSCYMVIRPEGAADLREHLRGGRIPTDVYLLRRMQVEDPNTGPVVRAAPPAAGPAPPGAQPERAPSAESLTPKPPSPRAPDPAAVSAPSASPAAIDAPAPALEAVEAPRGGTGAASGARAWKLAHALLRFDPPLPPPTHSAEDAPALFRWMLEQDPVIPNNLELLETIHAETFRDGPAGRLGYQQHLLVQIADDLLLHPTQEALDHHLGLLVAAYRRAAGAYHAAARRGRTAENETNAALWQMASMASRLRVEAWVFRTRYGAAPEAPPPRRPRASMVSAD